jgi:hypothetical protein
MPCPLPHPIFCPIRHVNSSSSSHLSHQRHVNSKGADCLSHQLIPCPLPRPVCHIRGTLTHLPHPIFCHTRHVNSKGAVMVFAKDRGGTREDRPPINLADLVLPRQLSRKWRKVYPEGFIYAPTSGATSMISDFYPCVRMYISVSAHSLACACIPAISTRHCACARMSLPSHGSLSVRLIP